MSYWCLTEQSLSEFLQEQRSSSRCFIFDSLPPPQRPKPSRSPVRLYHPLSSENHITKDFPTHKIMSTVSNTISLKIEFGGGLELLFSNQRSHRVTIPSTVPADNNTSPTKDAAESATRPADVTYLLHHLRDHLLKEREELFMENGTVCVDSSLFFPR